METAKDDGVHADPDTGPDTGPDADPDADPDGLDADPDPAPARSRWRVIAVVVVLAIAVVGGIRIVTLTNDRSDLQERNTQLEESLRIARGDAGAQIEMLESENSDLAQRVDELEAELASTADALASTRAEADDLEARLEERRLERDEARELVEELEDQLAEIGTRFEPMPVLIGGELEAAETFAADIGAELLVEEAAPTNVIARPGAIIEQLPIDGTVVLPGTVIWVQVYTPATQD